MVGKNQRARSMATAQWIVFVFCFAPVVSLPSVALRFLFFYFTSDEKCLRNETVVNGPKRKVLSRQWERKRKIRDHPRFTVDITQRAVRSLRREVCISARARRYPMAFIIAIIISSCPATNLSNDAGRAFGLTNSNDVWRLHRRRWTNATRQGDDRSVENNNDRGRWRLSKTDRLNASETCFFSGTVEDSRTTVARLTLKKSHVAPWDRTPYSISVCAAKSSGVLIGADIFCTIRYAVKLDTYDDINITVKNHQTAPTIRPGVVLYNNNGDHRTRTR